MIYLKFEGAISEQGKGIVHHLEVFHCQIPSEVTINHYDAPCSSKSERPPGLQTCTKVLGAWAMGAQVYLDKYRCNIGYEFLKFSLRGCNVMRVRVIIVSIGL